MKNTSIEAHATGTNAKRGDAKHEGTRGIDLILEAATSHGESSDPDHEVGDLQDALRAAWDIMCPGQRAALLLHPDVAEDLEAELPDGLLPSAGRLQAALEQEQAAAACGRSLYDRLVSQFPGFLDDSDVNGGDLVDWCNEHLHLFVVDQDQSSKQGGRSPAPPLDGAGHDNEEALLEAATHAALDEGCRMVQEHLGVESGDFAGVYFSGTGTDGVKEILRGYLAAERAQWEAHSNFGEEARG